jgi:hypothetical protein
MVEVVRGEAKMARFANFKLAGVGPIAVNIDQVIYVRPWGQAGSTQTQIVFAVGLESAAHSVIVEASMKDGLAAIDSAK